MPVRLVAVSPHLPHSRVAKMLLRPVATMHVDNEADVLLADLRLEARVALKVAQTDIADLDDGRRRVVADGDARHARRRPCRSCFA